MNTFLWLLAGGTLGWLAWSMIGLNGAWSSVVSIAVGALGGVLGGKMVAPALFGSAPPEGVAIGALMVAAVVAAGCLFVSSLVHNRMES